jgi:hypothetical protein
MINTFFFTSIYFENELQLVTTMLLRQQPICIKQVALSFIQSYKKVMLFIRLLYNF